MEFLAETIFRKIQKKVVTVVAFEKGTTWLGRTGGKGASLLLHAFCYSSYI